MDRPGSARRRHRRIAVIAALALLVPFTGGCTAGREPAARVGAEAPAAASLDEDSLFLVRWVGGERRSEMFEEFLRKYPDSPHAAESLRFEAAVHAFQARALEGERREALVGELHRLFEGGAGVPERALEILGRIGAVEEMETILTALADGPDPVRCAAADALGWFGGIPREETFLVFGGAIRLVVSPPVPDPRATAALVDHLRRATDPLRPQALEAARWHRSPELRAAAPELPAPEAEGDGPGPGIYRLGSR